MPRNLYSIKSDGNRRSTLQKMVTDANPEYAVTLEDEYDFTEAKDPSMHGETASNSLNELHSIQPLEAAESKVHTPIVSIYHKSTISSQQMLSDLVDSRFIQEIPQGVQLL